MSFWSIFLFALVILIVYYGVLIFMDLNAENSAEDNSALSEETEVDITEDAADFGVTVVDSSANQPSGWIESSEDTDDDYSMVGGMPVDTLAANLERMAKGEDVYSLNNIITTCQVA